MRLKQKVEYIASKLEELYPNPEIPLDHENNFTFLLSKLKKYLFILNAGCDYKKALFYLYNDAIWLYINDFPSGNE